MINKFLDQINNGTRLFHLGNSIGTLYNNITKDMICCYFTLIPIKLIKY